MNAVNRLYKVLLKLYPRPFRERLGESMEQTFHDLCQEQQTKAGWFGFVLWAFSETALGAFREHLLLISPGDIMQTMIKNIGSSALISFLLILPFMTMEVVNRRNFNEGFPILLFFGMWLNLFAISLILLPILRGRHTGNHEMADSGPAQESTRLTNPRSAAMVGVILVLSLVIVPLLDFLGWIPLQQLFNGPNPGQLSVFGVRVPSQFIALVLLSLPVAAGIIAGRPIVHTLRAGGSLFAHPVNLMIVVLILSIFAMGAANLIIDQWPCFIGVPNCD